MNEVMKKVMEAFKKEFGEDANLEDGDTVVFELNDCTLILSRDGGKVRTEFLGDKPIKVDCTTGFYSEV